MRASSDRRQFLRLTVGAILVLPAGRFLVACGSEEDGGELTGEDAPAAAPRAEGNGVVYTSSNVQNHAHTFTIENATFAAPPSPGVDAATSDVGGHSHGVAISMAQLAGVAAGQTVKITTENAGGHTHVLTLVKLSSSTGGGGGGGGEGDPGDPYEPY